ncbi:MAG: hypothetical protein MZV64_04900 [Ignavibacteriales bacterium]|nr:hypothetical protein [Ignavibacteriales bacterium]
MGWYESYLQDDQADVHGVRPDLRAVRDRGRGREDLLPAARRRRASSRTAGSLKPEWLEREPHNDIDAHFQRHDRFLVIDCVCKREKVAAARPQLRAAR